MKVRVLSDNLIYTGSDFVRSDYARGDVLEMEDQHVPQQVEAGNVEIVVEVGVKPSTPSKTEKIVPVPAPERK